MTISIIIATYNAGKTLQKCLDSIRPQKTDDVELLVIDGLSSDNTFGIIKENIDLINYFSIEKDQGIYDAWNKGITHSRGEWIMFLGADDVLENKALLLYLNEIEKIRKSHQIIDYISARVNYTDERGRLFKVLGRSWSWSEFSKSMSVAHVSSLHNRRLFDETGLFDLQYKICADYDLLLRKKEALKSSFIPETVASMQMGGMSLSLKAVTESAIINNKYINRTFLNKGLYFLSNYLKYILFKGRIYFWKLG